ncbi:beta-ketoacyl-ACP synthase [Marinihelvus fidelis]|uniref:Beta-ketoacyl-ACP synthase n=2 Tax=Marinihelvus fidelis TaxID=2613842 RepID=A0A5N0T9H5_9GAMM|nr:beta-ketoacyl-ACP synthase [Marinihelvus fidelis]
MQTCAINGWTLTSALGAGLATLGPALAARESGLRRNDFPGSGIDTWIGRVDGLDDGEALPERWRSRNNALAELGLAQDDFIGRVRDTRDRLGADRLGVIIGTSTSSIGRTEAAYRAMDNDRWPAEYLQPDVHQPHSPGLYVAHRLGITGPALTISTACASSAKVFASGWRWLQSGVVDAVVVGGVDSLCHSVLGGFSSLELTSTQPCRPFDTRRDGISLGEAAGFALLTRPQDAPASAPWLAGYGETSDAFHMSQPPENGAGAEAAMRAAIGRAGLDAAEIGYANLHGTASQANDIAESRALSRVFGEPVPVSSTKGWTGHTLGAAGIVEAVIALQALVTGLLPGTLNLSEPDPGLAFPILQDNLEASIGAALSNSFGFGGNNCSLVFRRRLSGAEA